MTFPAPVSTLLIILARVAAHGKGEDYCPSRMSMLEYRVSMLETRASSCLYDHKSAELEDEQIQECERGMGDGVTRWYPPYTITYHSRIQREILCDTHTGGGGWIIFQRRAKGDVDFYKDWKAYRDGFGSLAGDFWLGNEAIHQLTNDHLYTLRIDMRIKGGELFAEYSSFKLEDESNMYRLQLGPYSGTVGEDELGLSFQNKAQFSTFDRSNAVGTSVNCGIEYHGAWWYNHYCTFSNLNGLWGVRNFTGISWRNGNGYLYPTFTEMKIRRV